MENQIYLGPWINHSHGFIRGMTITLSDRAGGLLTAFIAAFVTIVGAELWKILCYVLHQVRSESTAQDGLYHQQQVILRTSPTPGGAAWLFLQQSWHWAGRARLAIVRTLPWALFSTVYIIAIGVTAIFSSEISKSPGPQRLLSSANCGIWTTDNSSDSQSAYTSKSTNDSLSAASYARACYGLDYDPLRCSRYPVRALNWTSNINATCPFESGTCRMGDTAAISMSTGTIDSHHDLGINAPEDSRIQLLKTTTCAPINARPYAVAVNVTEENVMTEGGRVGDIMYTFNFGPTLNDPGLGNITDYTWYYNDHTRLDNIGYSLQAKIAYPEFPVQAGVFQPIPAFNTTSSDLSLIFIAANSIKFDAPCSDPVFAANDLNNATEFPFYWSDKYAAFIGCSEQYQICNPVNNKCTPKVGAWQLKQRIEANNSDLSLNPFQNTTAMRLTSYSLVTSMFHATATRGGGSLRAVEKVSQLSQAPLPANQWHIEVGAWFDAGLARLQALTQEYVTNPTNLVPGSYLIRTPTVLGDPWWQSCHSQLVNETSDTRSFSVVGLVILFGLGGLIIFTSLTIDTVVGFIQSKTGMGVHAKMEWMVNDRLHMQRLLYREMALGQWYTGMDKKIPVTIGGQQQFVGPAERELGTQRLSKHGVEREYDGSEVQLVQREHVQPDKGGFVWAQDR